MRRRDVILCLVLATIVIAAGSSALVVWKQQQRTTAIRAAIPRLPDLSRWPPEFAARLRTATDKVVTEKDPAASLGQLAALYFENGFDPEARALLGKLSVLDPANARWPYFIAELDRREGHAARAEPALRRVTTLDPAYVPAWLRLGEILAQAGRLDEARDCFDRAISVAPPKEVRTAYARIDFEAHHGNRGDPRQDLVALLRDHSDIKQLHELLADLDTAAGDPAGAALQRALSANAEKELENVDPWIDELSPQCYDAGRLSLLAIAAYRERRLDAAEKLLEHAIALAPADGLLRDSLAHVYELRGEPDQARKTLERAVAECPDDPMMPIRLARLLSLEHRSANASALLRRALQRWPADARLHAALGLSLRDEQKPAEALQSFQEATRLDPSFVEAYYNLGFCLLVVGRRDEARAAVEKAVAMRPDYADALLFLGSLALETEDVAVAEKPVMHLHDLRPDDPGAKLLFATLQLLKGTNARRSGDDRAAEKYFQAGLGVSPDFGPLLLESGVLASQHERFADAASIFEHYLQVEPADPRGYVAFGKCLLALGRMDKARPIFERGLAVAEKAGATAQAEECRRLLQP